MKQKLLLALLALFTLGGSNLFAQQEPANEGVYYLYNTATGKFLTRGNTYGTQCVTNDFGSPWQVTVATDGTITLRMFDIVSDGGTSGLGDNGYSDNGSPITFTLSGDVNGYKLQNGSNYLCSPDTYGNNVLYSDADYNTTWQFLNVTEYQAVLAAKTATQEAAVATAANVDITGTTLAAVVGNADNYTATDMSSSIPFPSNSTWTRTNVPNRAGDTNQGNYGVENYQGGGTYSHTVTGLASGIYKVGVRAMFRSGNNAICSTVGDAGYVNSSAYFSANGKLVQVKDWYSSRVSADNPNSTDAFVAIANNGGYYAEVYTYVGEDGVLELKAVSESFWWGSWFLFNGCTLTYYLDKSAEVVVPTSITLNQSAANLLPGSTLALTATVAPEDALDKSLTWTSSDETVATVDAQGVVTALATGTATITATSVAAPSVKATCTVTVANAAAPAFYSEIGEGDFYIVNVATGKYLGGGNDWGTHASIIEHGIPFTAAKINDGVYTLDSHIFNSATDHFCNGSFCDQPATNLYIKSVGDGKYSISTAEGSNFMTAQAGNTLVEANAADATSAMAQWYFVTKADRDKALANATATNPADATYYIKNPQFSRNMNTQWNEASWTMEASNQNLSGGDDSNRCAESFHALFTLSQELTVPNGTYRFRAQGFYRQDGSDNTNLPVFYANDATVTFPARTGSEGSMAAASASFLNGLYHSEWGEVTVTDHKLKIGAKLEGNTALWCIFDNFELEMIGYTPVTEVDATAEANEIEIGETTQITAEVTPEGASFDALTYTSSNEEVATVDENGLVTAVAEGEVVITVAAENEDVSATVNIAVVAPAIVPTEITVAVGEETVTELALDENTPTVTLVATVLPEGVGQAVTFASSDENVVTVNAEGVVTAVAPGEATITVTSVVKNDVVAELPVTVTFPESVVPATKEVADGPALTVATLSQDNLFKNGSFGYGNPVYGWKTVGYATDAVASNFTITAEGGAVDGGAYITTNGEGAGSAKTIRKSVAVEVGKKYYFAVYTSGKAPAANNFPYNALFKMSDATTEAGVLKEFEWPQGANNTTTEWSLTECIFTAETPYVGVRMGWNASSSFDNFVLVEVTDETTVGNVQYALDAIPTANVGTGAFQYSQDAIDAANALVQGEATVEDVTNAYNAVTTVNAPAEGQLFNVVLTYDGWTYDNKAMTYIANGRTDGGNYNIQYKEEANQNLAQAFTFTKVEGNNYKMSQIDADGVARYISTGQPYGGNASQIRTTTNADDALFVTVIPTATEGKWNLRNTAANNYIGSQDAGVYTVNSHIDFKLVETQKPSIIINTTAAGWGTTILPFAAQKPADVKVYTCAEMNGTDLVLTEVDALEANKPYVIEGAWNETLTGDAQGTQLNYVEGLLTGVYAQKTQAAAGTYVMQMLNGKVAFYKVAEGTAIYVPANRAYLTGVSSEAKVLNIGNGETNGINAIQALIDGDAEIFNVNGVKQNSLQKGVNIIKMSNGETRKIMVK
ncbi:MAG: Ig domain-containing protein [Prevotella sp.]|nr:Ig domain-containing protein [Prevotella sp.]